MKNVQAKEKLLKEFDTYWVEVDKTEYGYQIKEDLKKIFFQALDRLEEQTKRETIEEIKREINKRMLVMPRPSIEQWNENLTEGTTYIRGVDLVPLFNKLTSPKALVEGQTEEKQSTGEDKI